MKIEMTTANFDLMIESLIRYQGILERDAAGLGRLDAQAARRRAEELMKEAGAVEALIEALLKGESPCQE